MLGILIIIVSLVFFIRQDKYSLFFLFILSVISIPFNENIINFLKLNLFNIDARTVPLILIFMMDIIKITYRNSATVNFNKIDISVVIGLILFTIYLVIGVVNTNPFFSADLKTYIIFPLLYIVWRNLPLNGNMLKKLINIFNVSSVIYSLTIIYIYLFSRDSLMWIYGAELYTWWGNRIAFGNTSLLLITSMFALNSLWAGKGIIKYSFVLMTNVFAVLISQNKSIISLLALCIAIFIIQDLFINRVHKNKTKLKIGIYFILSPILVSMILLVLRRMFEDSNSLVYSILNRFLFDTSSLDVREISNNFALHDILSKPFGFGVGKELILYNANYSVASSGPFLDNSFITIGMKFGFIGMGILVCSILICFYNIIKYYKFSKKNQILIMAYVYPCFIFITAIMNAQILYSLPVAVSFISLFCIFNQYNKCLLSE